jgi:hypothetical protein
MSQQPETEFMGGRKAKMWTYLIFGLVLVAAILVFSFAMSNPDLAKSGVKSIAGLPAWAFSLIAFVLGVLVFWMGLKLETDWPEAVGALLIAGSVASAEVMIGWRKLAVGGIWAIPLVVPVVIFVVLLMVGMSKSR